MPSAAPLKRRRYVYTHRTHAHNYCALESYGMVRVTLTQCCLVEQRKIGVEDQQGERGEAEQ